MIESPCMKEVVEEAEVKASAGTKAETILAFRGVQFGPVPAGLADILRARKDSAGFDRFLEVAAGCLNLDSFRMARQDQ